jgi:hypothetical protein
MRGNIKLMKFRHTLEFLYKRRYRISHESGYSDGECRIPFGTAHTMLGVY